MDKTSYALGMGIGRQLLDMGAGELDIDVFAQAIKDVMAGKRLLSDAEAQETVQAFFRDQEAKQRAAAAEKHKALKERGEKFLAANAKKEGVVTTASGLQYEVVREGSGAHPKASDTVRCHYEGRLIDGTVFDSSYKRGEPASFGLSQVISGWTEGLQLMAVGARFRFYIPYGLGYGECGAGASIPPYSTLIFDVELLEISG